MDQPEPGSLTAPGDTAPDLIDDEGTGDLSGLDLLRRAAERKAETEDRIEWTVPALNPDDAVLKVRYTTKGLDPGRMQSILRRSRDKKTGEIHGDTSNCLVLAQQCVGLVIDGHLATEDGRPLVFADSAVRALFGVENAADAVRVFYGGAGKDYGFTIQRHANDLLTAAGLGDRDEEPDTEDPTTGPTT